MMLHIPGVLSPADVAQMREALEAAEWEDGRVTAGHLAVRAKANLQLPVESPLAGAGPAHSRTSGPDPAVHRRRPALARAAAALQPL
jgi:hypothetical protein